jgi:hypothetical protein
VAASAEEMTVSLDAAARGAHADAREEDGASEGRSRVTLAVGGVLLAVVSVLLPVALASHYGALDLPRSDDWSYLLSVFRWVDTGHLSFNNWAGTTLIAQLALAAPVAAVFPRSVTAIHVTSAVVSWLGLLAVVWMARTTMRDSWAVVVALTIAVSPLWMPLAATFMTDNWAFTFQIASLAMAFEAFRRSEAVRPGWFTASMIAGVIAIAIRQYAAVPVIACAIVAVGRAATARDRRVLRIVALVLAAAVVVVTVLLVWWSQRPTLDTLPLSFPNATRVRSTVQLDLGYLRLVGLLLLPVVLLANPVRIVRRAVDASAGVTACVASVSAIVLVLEYAKYPNTPFVGNYFARSGVLGQDVLAGNRPDVIPALWFDLLVWIAMASAVVVLLAAVPIVVRFWREGAHPAALVRGEGGPIAVCGWCFVGFAAMFTLVGLVGLPTDDRYVLPLLPLVAIGILHAGAREPRQARGVVSSLVIPGAALVLLLAVGVAFTADSASFDATRWTVAQRATEATGLHPTQIDGGFEWVAWHRQTGPPVGRFLAASDRHRILAAFEAPFCVRVYVAPRTHLPARIVASADSSAPTRRPERIIAYRLSKPCSPHP